MKTKPINAGDYVFATKYSDGSPRDAWAVGFYHGKIDHFGEDRHIVTDGKGVSFRRNGYRRVQRISMEVGDWFVRHADDIEKFARFSMWHYARNGPARRAFSEACSSNG